jgi:hypothetical protein
VVLTKYQNKKGGIMKNTLNKLSFTDLGKLFKIMINIDDISNREDLITILNIKSKSNLRTILKSFEDNEILYRDNKFDKDKMNIFFNDKFLNFFNNINLFKNKNNIYNYPVELSGVYILYENDKVVYVGKSNNMKNRITQHKKDKEFNKIICLSFENEGDKNIYELYYISKFKPKYNKDCVDTSSIELKDILEEISKNHIGRFSS